MNIKTVDILKDELWIGGIIDDTVHMPYSAVSDFEYDLEQREAYNQVSPTLLSSKGRYFYFAKGGKIIFKNGKITVESVGDIDFGEKENFKAAYNFVKDKYYAFDGRYPYEKLFTCPQYCTWMSLFYDQTQEGVIKVAESILEAGLPAGELIIDDNWAPYMGALEFDRRTFPDPKGMCDKLKEMGFFVTLWVVPYVSPDTVTYRFLKNNDMLYKKDGKPFLSDWWDGYSACMDFTNPKTVEWWDEKVRKLVTEYGIAGLKMDGGDNRLYADGLESFDKISHTKNELSELYGILAAKYSVSEIRSTFKCEGLPVMQRIADRFHAWSDEKNGFGGIVKKSLVMSLMGYPYNCPDMVGGGQSDDLGKSEDNELNIRYMEAATFMPSFQFSKKVWTFSEAAKNVVLKMVDIRKPFNDYILELVKKCAYTGEPIIRTMLYQYGIMPENYDQFTVGDKILVAPVMEQGQTEKTVYLPAGKWQFGPDGKVYDGDCTVKVSAPLDVLPYFIKK